MPTLVFMNEVWEVGFEGSESGIVGYYYAPLQGAKASGVSTVVYPYLLTSNYCLGKGFGRQMNVTLNNPEYNPSKEVQLYAKISADFKTISWYSRVGDSYDTNKDPGFYQFNALGKTYRYVAII